MRRLTLVLTALILLGLGAAARAQSPAQAASRQPDRIRVAVMDFDYGTISNPWWGDRDIGKGVADQVVDGLVNDGTLRVIERKKLDSVLTEQDFAHSDRAVPDALVVSKVGKILGVRYIVAGSITKFGTEEKNFNAGAAKFALGPMGALGFKKGLPAVLRKSARRRPKPLVISRVP